jgi:hypothetical protein
MRALPFSAGRLGPSAANSPQAGAVANASFRAGTSACLHRAEPLAGGHHE